MLCTNFSNWYNLWLLDSDINITYFYIFKNSEGFDNALML